jgi:cytochrome c2
MQRSRVCFTLLVSIAAIASAQAQDENLADAEKLYVKECSVCHGTFASTTGERRNQDAVRLAMGEVPGVTMRDFLGGISAGPHADPSHAAAPPVKLAVAPPYGPHLRGIMGREAGTVQGFVYSKAFMKALQGMKWDEASLDVWLTSPQKWVPGVYMFYSQKDAEVRRKIIQYLKMH